MYWLVCGLRLFSVWSFNAAHWASVDIIFIGCAALCVFDVLSSFSRLFSSGFNFDFWAFMLLLKKFPFPLYSGVA